MSHVCNQDKCSSGQSCNVDRVSDKYGRCCKRACFAGAGLEGFCEAGVGDACSYDCQCPKGHYCDANGWCEATACDDTCFCGREGADDQPQCCTPGGDFLTPCTFSNWCTNLPKYTPCAHDCQCQSGECNTDNADWMSCT